MLTQTLTQIISDAFAAAGYDSALGRVDYSNRPDLCQFQCNGAMGGAKQYRKAPAAIANEVLSQLADNPHFTADFAAPGFINITLKDEYLSQYLTEIANDSRLGLPLLEETTLVIDYGGANIAKPLHVGHLRPAIIGEALKRITRFLGRKVIGDVHFGDWGLQMGLVMASIERKQPALHYFGGSDNLQPDVTLESLNEIYPAASALSKTDAEFRKRAGELTQMLQDGDKGIRALWQFIVDLSVTDIKAGYGRLNVDFDVWLGESDAQPFIPELLDILNKRGILYLSEGAYIVDVAEDGDAAEVPPVLITKSDGASLYATTDLATIIMRMKDFEPDEIWYLTDNRQALHFTQVFRCAKKAGIVPTDFKFSFVGNGTMNGIDGKPYKTRDGGVMTLNALINQIIEAAREKVSDNADITDDGERDTISRQIGIAALKFGDLANHRVKDYIFDIDRFISFEGKTGPYILYTAVRINSLLRKAADIGAYPTQLLPPSSDSERELMLRLTAAGDSLVRACADKTPSTVCDYLFTLSSAFNRFYISSRIIAEPDEARRGSWLSLLKLTRDMIAVLSDLLGMEIPEKM